MRAETPQNKGCASWRSRDRRVCPGIFFSCPSPGTTTHPARLPVPWKCYLKSSSHERNLEKEPWAFFKNFNSCLTKLTETPNLPSAECKFYHFPSERKIWGNERIYFPENPGPSPPVYTTYLCVRAFSEGWHFALCSVPPKNLINVVELWAFIQKLQLGRSHALTLVAPVQVIVPKAICLFDDPKFRPVTNEWTILLYCWKILSHFFPTKLVHLFQNLRVKIENVIKIFLQINCKL